jgi:hypothetical protein
MEAISNLPGIVSESRFSIMKAISPMTINYAVLKPFKDHLNPTDKNRNIGSTFF